MNAADVVGELRTVLENEREAIRTLDVGKVEEAAAAKERLLAALRSTPPSEREAITAVLTALRSELRRNLVLLAHARDCLRGALAAVSTTRVTTEL